MDLAIIPHGNVTVVKIQGQINDGPPAERLQDALKELIRENKAHTIFDLAGVKWFDSLAIGILVCHYVSVTRLEGKILFLGASDRIKTLMKIVRLDDRFGWADDLDEALSWFGG